MKKGTSKLEVLFSFIEGRTSLNAPDAIKNPHET